MKQAELLAEVERLIEDALDAKRATKKSWLVQTVLAAYGSPEGEGAEFFTLCAYEHLQDTVRSVLSRYRPKPDDESQRQLPMPGYERLQRGYLVERDGESTITPVVMMTDAEVQAKAREYRSIGDGCHAHADELERYLEERGQVRR